MKKVLHLFFYFFISSACYSQVGIHTTTPAGMLEVTSGDNTELGLVLPIVAKFEDVKNPIIGESVKRGTTVFDEQRNTICYKTISGWSCVNGDTVPDIPGPQPPIDPNAVPAYIKASNTRSGNMFGQSIAISFDGNTLAIGSDREKSNATSVNGDENDTSLTAAGAVYIFTRSGTTWTQQAYIKASNNRANSVFGYSVSLSANGNILAVGAYSENSKTTGINGDQSDTSLDGNGAVYIFTRSGTNWAQQAYIKASNSGYGYGFGLSTSLSSEGNTLAVGSYKEGSASSGINGEQTSTTGLTGKVSGAVYMFTRSGTTWTQQAFIKASNNKVDQGCNFGESIALSSDGNTLAVGDSFERSNTKGINGAENTSPYLTSGAAYVFTRNGTTWTQQAFIKPSNTAANIRFGSSVSLSFDGNTLAVGSGGESTGSDYSGAAYVFTRNGTTWTQQAFLKSLILKRSGGMGSSIYLSANGDTMLVGARADGISATSSDYSGGAYIFTRSGTTWTQKAYFKAPVVRSAAYYGERVVLSGNGNTMVVSAPGESSSAKGINGDQTNSSASNAGAVYVYEIR